MTELEKAASGLLYDANSDPALLEARAQTSNLCMDYNALRSSQKEEKNALLHTILGACAPDIVIEPPFFVDFDRGFGGHVPDLLVGFENLVAEQSYRTDGD